MVVCNFFKECLADSSFGLSVVILCFSGEPSVFTMTSKGNILKRFSSTISPSLVVSFFTQRARHPQVKSRITERKDGLIEGRRSCARRDLELKESIFQSSSNSFLSDTQDDGPFVEKSQKNLIPGSTTVFIIRFSFVLICLICCFLAPTLLNCWSDDP